MKKIISLILIVVISIFVQGGNCDMVSFAEQDKSIPDDVLAKITKVVNEPSRFKDLERKSRDERKNELIDIYKKSGVISWLYNVYGLDIKDFRNYDDFFTTRDAFNYVIKKWVQKNHKYKNVNNKKGFAQYMQEVCPECIPKTYFFIKNGRVEEGELAGQDFISAVSTLQDGKYFFKKTDGSQGKSVFLIEKLGEKITINNGMMSLDKLLNLVNSESEFIMQESIVQHPEIAKFNPGTVNTVRIVTTKFNKNVYVLAAALRMGANKNSVVDNAHSGGTFVGIDDATGKLLEWGYYDNTHSSRERSHPLSNITYLGTQIPHWNEVVELVKKLHKYCDYYTSIGWDIAITEDGPKVIELNTYWGLDVIQGPHGGLKQKWNELRHAE